MLWPHALVPVWQQQHQAAHPLPLGFATREKLVNDHLRAVDEIAELGLPQDQATWVCRADSVLKAEYC